MHGVSEGLTVEIGAKCGREDVYQGGAGQGRKGRPKRSDETTAARRCEKMVEQRKVAMIIPESGMRSIRSPRCGLQITGPSAMPPT